MNGPEDIVVFGGASAGGRGAMTHLDSIAGHLEKYGVRVLGHLDSPLYLDIATLKPSTTLGLNKQMKSSFENYNEKSFMP